MLKNLSAIAICVFLLVSCSYDRPQKCSGSVGSNNAQRSAEVDRQIKKYTEQQAKADEQQARIEAQMKRAEEQQKRMESLITRWEAQADRYDAILNRWEKQAPLRK